MVKVDIDVDPTNAFRNSVRRATKGIRDLRIPLTLISKDFYKSEKSIFRLKGPGQYADLKDSTRQRKIKVLGQAYPILKFTGKLEKSITTPNAAGSINQIFAKTSLIIGTSIPYGTYLQSGTRHMAARPFVFIGPEAKQISRTNKLLGGRVGRWSNILNDYVLKVMEREGFKVFKSLVLLPED